MVPIFEEQLKNFLIGAYREKIVKDQANLSGVYSAGIMKLHKILEMRKELEFKITILLIPYLQMVF